MGRNIPSYEITTSRPPTLLSLAIFVTWIAAVVAAISSLCGLWSKKTSKSTSKEKKKTAEITTEAADSPPSKPQSITKNNVDDETTTTNDDELLTKPLPPPPSAAKLEFGEPTGNTKPNKIDKSSSLQNYISKGSTRRKLSSSISMKMSMKIKDNFKDKASEIKDKASEIKEKASDFSHRKTKNDNESLWKKKIILGEKCRLPNGDDDDEVMVAYNDEHVSNSFIKRDASSSVRHDEKLVKEEGKGKEKVDEFDDEDDS